jgi:hypothetical protein
MPSAAPPAVPPRVIVVGRGFIKAAAAPVKFVTAEMVTCKTAAVEAAACVEFTAAVEPAAAVNVASASAEANLFERSVINRGRWTEGRQSDGANGRKPEREGSGTARQEMIVQHFQSPSAKPPLAQRGAAYFFDA